MMAASGRAINDRPCGTKWVLLEDMKQVALNYKKRTTLL